MLHDLEADTLLLNGNIITIDSEGITSHTEAGIEYLSELELLAYQQAVQVRKLHVRSYLMVPPEEIAAIDVVVTFVDGELLFNDGLL